MKKALFIFCLPLASYAQHKPGIKTSSYALPVDKANGFRDMKLGTHVSAHSDLVEQLDSGKVSNPNAQERFFRRPHDGLAIGASKVDRITYYYYNNKLYSVTIEARGFLNSQNLLDALVTKYGSGHFMRGSDINEGDTQACDWAGRIAEAYYMGYTVASDKVYVTITSLPLQRQAEAEKNRKTKGQL